eukprot:3632025-Rhodomonas_salina.1
MDEHAQSKVSMWVDTMMSELYLQPAGRVQTDSSKPACLNPCLSNHLASVKWRHLALAQCPYRGRSTSYTMPSSSSTPGGREM